MKKMLVGTMVVMLSATLAAGAAAAKPAKANPKQQAAKKQPILGEGLQLRYANGLEPTVEKKQENQAKRIEHGVMKGALTEDEATRLQAHQEAIQKLEATFKSEEGLGRENVRQLQQTLNKASVSIWTEKRAVEGGKLPAHRLGSNIFVKADFAAKLLGGTLPTDDAKAIAKDFGQILALKHKLATGDLEDSDRTSLQQEFDELINRYFELREQPVVEKTQPAEKRPAAQPAKANPKQQAGKKQPILGEGLQLRYANGVEPAVDKRQEDQGKRIEHGVRKGCLTEGEATKLQAQQKAIQSLETSFKSAEGLSREEVKQLQQALNKASQSIWAEKYDPEASKLPVHQLGKNIFMKADFAAKLLGGTLPTDEAKAIAKDFRGILALKHKLATGELEDSERAGPQQEFDELINRYFELRERAAADKTKPPEKQSAPARAKKK